MLQDVKRYIFGGIDRIGIYCNDPAGGAAAHAFVERTFAPARSRISIFEKPSDVGVPYLMVHHAPGLLRRNEGYSIVPLHS